MRGVRFLRSRAIAFGTSNTCWETRTKILEFILGFLHLFLEVWQPRNVIFFEVVATAFVT